MQMKTGKCWLCNVFVMCINWFQMIGIDWSLMNHGDCFILDLGNVIIPWFGHSCNRMEKMKVYLKVLGYFRLCYSVLGYFSFDCIKLGYLWLVYCRSTIFYIALANGCKVKNFQWF